MDKSLTNGIYQTINLDDKEGSEIFRRRVANIISYMITLLGGESCVKTLIDDALADFYGRDGKIY